jgi:hypothetical protein
VCGSARGTYGGQGGAKEGERQRGEKYERTDLVLVIVIILKQGDDVGGADSQKRGPAGTRSSSPPACSLTCQLYDTREQRTKGRNAQVVAPAVVDGIGECGEDGLDAQQGECACAGEEADVRDTTSAYLGGSTDMREEKRGDLFVLLERLVRRRRDDPRQMSAYLLMMARPLLVPAYRSGSSTATTATVERDRAYTACRNSSSSRTRCISSGRGTGPGSGHIAVASQRGSSAVARGTSTRITSPRSNGRVAWAANRATAWSRNASP